MKLINTKDYLLLIDEEAEINSGDYWIYINPNTTFDEFVERTSLSEKHWFSKLHDRFAYKKVVAYWPLKVGTKELELPLLPNPYENRDVDILFIKRAFEAGNRAARNLMLKHSLSTYFQKFMEASKLLPTVFIPEETFQEPSEYVIVNNVMQGVYL